MKKFDLLKVGVPDKPQTHVRLPKKTLISFLRVAAATLPRTQDSGFEHLGTQFE